jgi:hypothetical protein
MFVIFEVRGIRSGKMILVMSMGREPKKKFPLRLYGISL